MKLLTVVGNRPQFIKASVLSKALASNHQEVLVHTGQHHDYALSARFFAELELKEPDHFLGISGGSNASQLGRMLPALVAVIEAEEPDAVLVYGDTNTTLAGSLAAATVGRSFGLLDRCGKEVARRGVPLIHVEAGMRSDDWTMPEEHNRVLTDHLATLLVCSTERAQRNLEEEGLLARPGRIAAVCGDLMADLAVAVAERAGAATGVLQRLGLEPKEYLLVTAHRAGNVDRKERLEALVGLLAGLAKRHKVVLPLHPRTRNRLVEFGLLGRVEAIPNLVITPPLPYLETATLLHHARAALTDSGGLQKEAYLAGVRCLTLRDRTEWQETVDCGWNFLVDLSLERAVAALEAPLPQQRPPLFGAGQAAQRTAAAIDALAQRLVRESR